MPNKLYKPTCNHHPGVFATSDPRCDKCRRPFESAGWFPNMIDGMSSYVRVYGLKPIGPHRRLADELLGAKRNACGTCDGRGIVDISDGSNWQMCPTCNGNRGTWNCDMDEVIAARNEVLRQFPDAAVRHENHEFGRRQ